MLAAVFVACSAASAQSPDILVDGGFEAGGSGWIAYPGADLSVDAGQVHTGSAAARIAASSPGSLRVETQYWLTTVVPSTAYTLRGWVADDDAAIEAVAIRLRFLDADGNMVDEWSVGLNGDTSGYRQLIIGPANSPQNAAYAQVVVVATALDAGAAFHVDSVTLEQGAPPTPSPTSTATAAATASPTASATPTTTPTVAPTKTATPSPTPTKTPTPPRGPVVFDEFTNGDFALDLFGWSNQGGELYVGGGYVNQSAGAVLMSQSSATKWLYQVVRVEPGAWYDASGWVASGGDAAAVWLRIAWYGSEDGSGSQLAVVDSLEVVGGPHFLATAATQAPPNAHSAAIRVVLRPASGGFASVAADDLAFSRVPPPATATPTATPLATASPVATPLPLPTQSRTVAPTSSARRTTHDAPRSAPPADAAPVTGGGTSAQLAFAAGAPVMASTATRGVRASPLIRITEVLPDALEPGLDSDFEWVELANLGTEGASLVGLVLRDNSGEVVLPDTVVPPGGAMLVAAPLADIASALALHRVPRVGNGLGNAGDRLSLETESGAVLDAFSWGSDSTYRDPESPIPAPGAGRSIERRFADDGSYLDFAILDVPAPGVPPEPVTIAFADGPLASNQAPASQVVAAPGDDRTGWLVLLAVASVALVAAAIARLREVIAQRQR